MKKFFLMLPLFLSLAVHAATPVTGVGPQSFGVTASGGSPFVGTYDYTNPMSLIYVGNPAGWSMQEEVCIVNGTAAMMAVMVDWGQKLSNPPQPSANAMTILSPEIMLGPGLIVCPPRFAANVFVRTLTGGTVTSGSVYGYSR